MASTKEMPQTSHGRGRKSNQPSAGGIKKREEKTQGLGETSKDLFSGFDEPVDESTKQII